MNYSLFFFASVGALYDQYYFSNKAFVAIMFIIIVNAITLIDRKEIFNQSDTLLTYTPDFY